MRMAGSREVWAHSSAMPHSELIECVLEVRRRTERTHSHSCVLGVTSVLLSPGVVHELPFMLSAVGTDVGLDYSESTGGAVQALE